MITLKRALVRLTLLVITFFVFIFFFCLETFMNCDVPTMTLSSTEVVAWPQSLSFIEVKWRWTTLVLGWVTASVHYSCL